MSEELTYHIEMRGKYYCVMSDKGHLCGIFGSKEKAELAIPNIAFNIKRGFVPGVKPKLIPKRRKKKNFQRKNKNFNKKENQ